MLHYVSPPDLRILVEEADLAAHRLVRQFSLPRADLDDVRQDILLDVLSRVSAFDPQRGTLGAFAGTIARHRATRIANRVRRERSLFGFNHRSLDDPRFEMLGEAISSSDGLAGLHGAVDEPHQRVEITQDVRRAAASLPRRLRPLCRLLQHTTPSSAQRTSGLSRATFYRRLREIRLLFLVEGLEGSR